MNELVCAQIKYLDGCVHLCCQEQPLALKVHSKVVKITVLKTGYRNLLQELQRRVLLSANADCQKNEQNKHCSCSQFNHRSLRRGILVRFTPLQSSSMGL